MEYTAVFEERVSLTPRDIRGAIKNIDTILEGKIRARLEGKCSRHGYVLNDSTKILSRSMGSLERGRFTGHLIFHVQVEGKVLNPPDKTILDGEVIRKNKMGLYVILNDAIRIMIPRDLHIGNESFDKVEIGDRIRIEIKKSRYQMNDTHILSIGQYLGKIGQTDLGTPDQMAGAGGAEAGRAVDPASREQAQQEEEEEEQEEEEQEEEEQEEEQEEE